MSDLPAVTSKAQNEAEAPTTVTKLPLTEGMLIAVVSAAAYLFAFRYQTGYADFYGIPTQLINVTLVNILIFMVSAYVSIVIIIPILDLFSSIPNIPFIPLNLPRLGFFFFMMVIVPLYLLGLSEWPYWVAPLIGIGIIVVIYIVIPILTHRDKGTVKERFEAQIEIDSRSGPLLVHQAASYLPNGQLLFLVFIVAFYLSTVVGRSTALNKKVYLVTNTSPELVVLDVNGDNIICAPFDREKKEVERRFTILKVNEEANVVLTVETIGPLKPVPARPKLASSPAPTPVVAPTPTPSIAPSPQESQEITKPTPQESNSSK